MSNDRVELGSAEMPDVLRTLAGVLPQFKGEDLESQLQTYDMFLGMLAPSVRPQVAQLLRDAAAKTQDPDARLRIEVASTSVAQGGRATDPYDHAKAMAEYQQKFREENPAPPPSDDPKEEEDADYEQESVKADEEEKDSDEEGDDEDEDEDDDQPEQVKKSHPKREHPLLLEHLDKIEVEMKKIGRWSDHTEEFQGKVDRGEVKSFLEAPTFEMWLQVVFLRNARQRTLEDDLPRRSQVGEMARRQYDYMSVDPDAEQLLKLLQEFDELIERARRGKA